MKSCLSKHKAKKQSRRSLFKLGPSLEAASYAYSTMLGCKKKKRSAFMSLVVALCAGHTAKEMGTSVLAPRGRNGRFLSQHLPFLTQPQPSG